MKLENIKYKIHIKKDAKNTEKRLLNTIHDVVGLPLGSPFKEKLIEYHDEKGCCYANINYEDVDLLSYTVMNDDANRRFIYEGMRCKATALGRTYEGIVVFNRGCFCLRIDKKGKNDVTYDIGQYIDLCDFNSLEVLGWIWKDVKEV